MVVVVVARMLGDQRTEEALMLLAVTVVAFKLVADTRVSPKMEVFRLMVLLPVMLMLLPPCRLMMGEVVAVTLPEASVARKTPAMLGR